MADCRRQERNRHTLWRAQCERLELWSSLAHQHLALGILSLRRAHFDGTLVLVGGWRQRRWYGSEGERE